MPGDVIGSMHARVLVSAAETAERDETTGERERPPPRVMHDSSRSGSVVIGYLPKTPKNGYLPFHGLSPNGTFKMVVIFQPDRNVSTRGRRLVCLTIHRFQPVVCVSREFPTSVGNAAALVERKRSGAVPVISSLDGPHFTVLCVASGNSASFLTYKSVKNGETNERDLGGVRPARGERQRR
jgi:hypothetical protein